MRVACMSEAICREAVISERSRISLRSIRATLAELIFNARSSVASPEFPAQICEACSIEDKVQKRSILAFSSDQMPTRSRQVLNRTCA